MVFIEYSFERVDSEDKKKNSPSLKNALNIAVRCETAIKTNGPLYKHPQLGVCPNLLNVLSLN